MKKKNNAEYIKRGVKMALIRKRKKMIVDHSESEGLIAAKAAKLIQPKPRCPFCDSGQVYRKRSGALVCRLCSREMLEHLWGWEIVAGPGAGSAKNKSA